MRVFASGALALALTTLSVAAQAEPTAEYASRLVADATAKGLATNDGWKRLVHYRANLFGGHTSEADAPEFFLAQDGRKDPQAELEATLRGFFSPPAAEGVEHPLCRFPARFLWLDEQLHFDPAELPTQACPKLEEFWQRTQVKALTVVFSSYYLNNPSSAFGHTFLRMNKATSGSPERRALLDMGIDYSANVPPKENTLAYAVKGLTGMFPGTFRMLPYYYKVREYNDFESRDLFEYELDLPRDEVVKVAAHVWELGHTYFDYYYLTENCSYHVLAALEVANPKYHLVDRIRSPVVPVDTVKALLAEPGLVSAVRYRPSARSTFRARVRDLSGAQLSAVAELSENPDATLPSLSEDAMVDVFDAALDLVDVRYAKELLDDRESRGATIKQKLLERRADLGLTSRDLTLVPSPEELPHLSHATSRIGLGTGMTDAHSGFQELRFRMALHDLADSPIGYPEHSQIEFFPTTVRFHEPTKRVELEDLSLVKITSLNPMNRFDYKPSWKLRVGATRMRDDGCASCVMGVVEGGSGIAVGEKVTAFATLDVSGMFPRFGGDEGTKARFGVGPAGGLRVRFHPRLVSLTTANYYWQPAQTPKTTWSAASTLRWQYAQNWASEVAARKQPLGSEVSVSALFYY